MDVSVVVPTLKNPRGLAKLLQALEDQVTAGLSFEVLVVHNDGSVPPAARSGRAVVRRLVEPTPGSYAARNRGVRESTGAVLAFIDDDCIPEREWLRHGVAAAATLGRPVGGRIRLQRPHSMTAAALYDVAFGLDQERYVQDGGYAATANLFVSREVFDQVGPFDARLLSGGDVEWGQRASLTGFPVAYEPRAIIEHPARGSLRELIRKQRRVAGGRQRLAELGLVPGLPSPSHAHPGPLAAVRVLPLVRPTLAVRRVWRRRDVVTTRRELVRLWLVTVLIDVVRRIEQRRVRGGGRPLR